MTGTERAMPAAHWSRLFALNADLLLNTLDGLSEEQANSAVVPEGNTIAFLVAHVTDSRHYLATLLGHPLPNPLEASLAGARSLAEVRTMPALATLRAAWVAVSRHLEAVLGSCDRARLEQPTAQRLPGSDGTLDGAVAFLLQHDSYHLGQIAMLRRHHGLPAMSYDPGALAAEGAVKEGGGALRARV
jgi:uncharacterized damage-inducible protein DinB